MQRLTRWSDLDSDFTKVIRTLIQSAPAKRIFSMMSESKDSPHRLLVFVFASGSNQSDFADFKTRGRRKNPLRWRTFYESSDHFGEISIKIWSPEEALQWNEISEKWDWRVPTFALINRNFPKVPLGFRWHWIRWKGSLLSISTGTDTTSLRAWSSFKTPMGLSHIYSHPLCTF